MSGTGKALIGSTTGVNNSVIFAIIAAGSKSGDSGFS
jgi:hypothetical protein